MMEINRNNKVTFYKKNVIISFLESEYKQEKPALAINNAIVTFGNLKDFRGFISALRDSDFDFAVN